MEIKRRCVLIVFLTIYCLFVYSCSLYKYVESATQEEMAHIHSSFAEKKGESMAKRYGIVFCIRNIYLNRSVYWTYKDDRMILYILTAKSCKKEEYGQESAFRMPSASEFVTANQELDEKCFFVLDGSECFYIWINTNQLYDQIEGFYRLNSIAKIGYNSPFLQRIQNDIIHFRLIEKLYQNK